MSAYGFILSRLTIFHMMTKESVENRPSFMSTSDRANPHQSFKAASLRQLFKAKQSHNTNTSHHRFKYM